METILPIIIISALFLNALGFLFFSLSFREEKTNLKGKPEEYYDLPINELEEETGEEFVFRYEERLMEEEEEEEEETGGYSLENFGFERETSEEEDEPTENHFDNMYKGEKDIEDEIKFVEQPKTALYDDYKDNDVKAKEDPEPKEFNIEPNYLEEEHNEEGEGNNYEEDEVGYKFLLEDEENKEDETKEDTKEENVEEKNREVIAPKNIMEEEVETPFEDEEEEIVIKHFEPLKYRKKEEDMTEEEFNQKNVDDRIKYLTGMEKLPRKSFSDRKNLLDEEFEWNRFIKHKNHI